MTPDGTHLMPGPLYHNGPFMWTVTALLAGNHVVLGGKFDAERTLQLIDQHHPDSMYVVPTMMARISKLPPERARSLRRVVAEGRVASRARRARRG